MCSLLNSALDTRGIRSIFLFTARHRFRFLSSLLFKGAFTISHALRRHEIQLPAPLGHSLCLLLLQQKLGDTPTPALEA